MSYCHDLCEQRDASTGADCGIENMVPLGAMHLLLACSFLTQFKVYLQKSLDMLLELCMRKLVAVILPLYLILRNK